MNIVYLHTDDSGRYVGCYGAPVDTPRITDLAKDGILFRNAFATSSLCSSSQVSLTTGQYSHTQELVDPCRNGFRIKNPEAHLASRLRAVGYLTQLIGFQHVTEPGCEAELGYQGIIPRDNLSGRSAELCQIAADWMRENTKQPFFLDIGLAETFEDARYYMSPARLTDEPAIRDDTSKLQTAVRHIDAGVGIILDTLRDTGLEESTLLIFTSDHGTSFPGEEATLFDAGIGVALIIRQPGGFYGGTVVESLISQVDILPTIFDAIGNEIPLECEGCSIMPIVRGDAEMIRWAAFAEINYHDTYDPSRCIRTPRYKYIRHYAKCPRVPTSNVDDNPPKDYSGEAQTWPGQRASEMLFDLLLDPHEINNLIEKNEYHKVEEELASMLDEWMKETNDPLLDGDSSFPEGAKASAMDDYDT